MTPYGRDKVRLLYMVTIVCYTPIPFSYTPRAFYDKASLVLQWLLSLGERTLLSKFYGMGGGFTGFPHHTFAAPLSVRETVTEDPEEWGKPRERMQLVQ